MEFGFYDSDKGFLKGKSNTHLPVGDASPAEYRKAANKIIKDNTFIVFTKSYCPYSRALK